MENNIPYFEDEDSKLKPDLPIIERDTVNVILWNPETKKVLCLDWEKFGWKTFIIGGIEQGEGARKGAEREIEEETGYINVEYMDDIGRLRSGYFAAHKNQNRIANTTGLLYQLKNTEQRPVDMTSLPHTFTWVDFTEVASFVNLSSQKYLWNKVLEKDYLI